jgi:hypothetical protein
MPDSRQHQVTVCHDAQDRAPILTFATTLVCGGTDLVLVAGLLGHARLDTVRACTRPAEDGRTKALNLLPTDR